MLLIASTLAALGAAATPATPPSSTAPETVTVDERYGLQVLAVDATAIALMAVSGQADSDVLATASVFVAGFGGGAIHLGHDEPARAVASVGLRFGLVIGGAKLLQSTASSDDNLAEAALGALLGYGAAVALDATVLARHHTTRRRAYAPQITANADTVRVGLAGSF